MSELLVKSYATTGIHPLDKSRMLKRLQHQGESPATNLVSPLIIDHIKELRYAANTKPNAVVRSKRLLVSPGKSVTTADVTVLSRHAAGPSRAVHQLHPTKKQ